MPIDTASPEIAAAVGPLMARAGKADAPPEPPVSRVIADDVALRGLPQSLCRGWSEPYRHAGC